MSIHAFLQRVRLKVLNINMLFALMFFRNIMMNGVRFFLKTLQKNGKLSIAFISI